MQDISKSHAAIIRLQREMLSDRHFKSLCEQAGLPWDPDAGYEPRWYNGPAPEDVRLLFLMAEPGPITPTEAHSLLPAVSHRPWTTGFDLSLQEHYWRGHLREFCSHIWPEDTEEHMYAHVGGTSTFWMSLPHGQTTKQVPGFVVNYFLEHYLSRFLSLFPQAQLLAVGGKARDRLKKLGVEFYTCSAFNNPEANKPRARESWRRTAVELKAQLIRPD